MANADEASALFRTDHDRIYRYVLSLVHNPSEADDLTQGTFLRAYSHRDSLRDPNAIRGWLYRIATRVCLDHLRQRVALVSLDGEEGASQLIRCPLRPLRRWKLPNGRKPLPACNAA